MCACDFNYTCPRCRDTRFDPFYLLDEPNHPDEPSPESERPTEFEVTE